MLKLDEMPGENLMIHPLGTNIQSKCNVNPAIIILDNFSWTKGWLWGNFGSGPE